MSSEFVWAIQNGDLDCVKDIMSKQSIDVNQEVDGRPLIVFAADYGQKDVIEYLIAAGANINAQDKHGITPLLAAIWEGHAACVELLLRNGAKKDGTTPDGKTYLEACERAEIQRLLA